MTAFLTVVAWITTDSSKTYYTFPRNTLPSFIPGINKYNLIISHGVAILTSMNAYARNAHLHIL